MIFLLVCCEIETRKTKHLYNRFHLVAIYTSMERSFFKYFNRNRNMYWRYRKAAVQIILRVVKLSYNFHKKKNK